MYTPESDAIALELAKEEPCTKTLPASFWEHFIYIAHAMSHRGHDSMDCERGGWLLLRRAEAFPTATSPMKIAPWWDDPVGSLWKPGTEVLGQAARFQAASRMVHR